MLVLSRRAGPIRRWYNGEGGYANLGSGCNHRRYSTALVYTELGCHARCRGCGTLGPGCSSSKAALQEFFAQKYVATSVRY